MSKRISDKDLHRIYGTLPFLTLTVMWLAACNDMLVLMKISGGVTVLSCILFFMGCYDLE